VPDSLPSIFGSLAAQFLSGLGIFYGIYNFFKTIDENLNEETSSGIADWLLGENMSNKSQWWADTFASVFDKVFGGKQLSWKCFGRSALVAIVSLLFVSPTVILLRGGAIHERYFVSDLPVQILFNLLPVYICVFITRSSIKLMRRYHSLLLGAVLLLVAAYVSYLVAASGAILGFDRLDRLINGSPGGEPFAGLTRSIDLGVGVIFGCLFASLGSLVWLASGLILSAARRLNLGFKWFNRTFDIRRKPLACLGLVAGTICAVLWWGYLIFVHLKAGAPS
jgi:hypothetical protein